MHWVLAWAAWIGVNVTVCGNLIPSLRPEGGGGGKRHFFSFYICDRAAEDEQVEKNRIKIRPCIPEILHAKV